MTNFEKIKSLSVEEMAKALAKYNAREDVCRRNNEKSSLDFCRKQMNAQTGRPSYADAETPDKFQAIMGIIATRLLRNGKAICSYSGGSDSDILIDLIERTREWFPSVPPVKYIFFNTGLEMQATKDHVKEISKKYGVEIEEIRPKIGIVQAVRKCGVPFASKIFSDRLSTWQKKEIPLSIAVEYEQAAFKPAKYKELEQRFPNSKKVLQFFCSCDKLGNPLPPRQTTISNLKYFDEFLYQNPPDFKISAKCCDYCKKQPAHQAQKDYKMIITGERYTEGGMRSILRGVDFSDDGNTMCFYTQGSQYRFRPLYYVNDKDKEWYKERYGIKYSDAYEVYGLKRTGCCGCPISSRAVEDLEKIRPYEPNVVRAAWNIFGKSYEYRQKYVEYKERRKAEEREKSDLQLHLE